MRRGEPGEGGTDRRWPTSTWRVPGALEVVDGNLLYTETNEKIVGDSRRHMLERFIVLHRTAKPAEKILGFARQFGVLELCGEHAMPVHPGGGAQSSEVSWCQPWLLNPEWTSYNEDVRYRASKGLPPTTREEPSGFDFPATFHDPQMCFPQMVEDGWVESIDAWCDWSAFFDRVMDLAIAHGDGRDALAETTALGFEAWALPRDPRRRDASALGQAVNYLLGIAGVQTQVTVDEGPPPKLRMVTSTPNLFAGLVFQIAGMVGSAAGMLAKCSSCGKDYTPSRKPAHNRHSYCVPCGNKGKAASRLSKRKTREKARTGQTPEVRSQT